MAPLSFSRFLSLPRYHLHWSHFSSLNLAQIGDLKLSTKFAPTAMSKKKASLAQEDPNGDGVVKEKKTSKSSKRATARTRKKAASSSPEEKSNFGVTNDAADEESISVSSEDSKKSGRTRRKVSSKTAVVEEEKKERELRGRRKTKKDDGVEDKVNESEASDPDEPSFAKDMESETEDSLGLENFEGEDISATYGWPPLVCCFGAAQHAFVPAGRPANRLIDYEIHERMKDALWAPEKIVRSPGSSAGSVAIALASLGGKVAFMGKLGDDDYGQAMLYYMNVNNVQTRSVRVDGKRSTAMSLMKIGRRSRLKMSCVKPCAEDSLLDSEINLDVLKEAKMFYFSTQSLLERSMRSTTLHAIKISKKLGGVIFYDANLPLPLWHSREETKAFLQQVWNLSDVIEVTKQELEFLCGITPSDEFDTKNNARSKFVHYEPEMIAPLWHENLKILFVTNGTSKIHYYTEEHNGAINGMEDAPITPFTCDMSASGDGIVAGLMRMLTVQPHLMTDRGYLEHTIKYAIDCGVIDQWKLGRTLGFPPKEDMEEEVTNDPNGIKSITEKEYRTLLESVS